MLGLTGEFLKRGMACGEPRICLTRDSAGDAAPKRERQEASEPPVFAGPCRTAWSCLCPDFFHT